MTLDDVFTDDTSSPTVTANEARREVERHGCDFEEFQHECGQQNEYVSRDVLEWLGY